MTPKEIAEYAGEVFTELCNIKLDGLEDMRISSFGPSFAFELTKVAVQAKLETAFAMSFDYSAD